jgi:hypothetical protein
MAGLSARFARWRTGVTLAVRIVPCRPNVPVCRGADTSALEQVPFQPGCLPVAWEIDPFQSTGYTHKRRSWGVHEQRSGGRVTKIVDRCQQAVGAAGANHVVWSTNMPRSRRISPTWRLLRHSPETTASHRARCQLGNSAIRIGRVHSWQVFDNLGSTSSGSLYQLSSYS